MGTKKKINKEGQVKKPVQESAPKTPAVKKKSTAIPLNKYGHREGSLMQYLDDMFTKGMDVFSMIKELNKIKHFKGDTELQKSRVYKHCFRLKQKGVAVKFDPSRKFYKIIK